VKWDFAADTTVKKSRSSPASMPSSHQTLLSFRRQFRLTRITENEFQNLKRNGSKSRTHMTDPAPNFASSGDNGGTPRWVKVFGIIAIVLVLLFVILHLTGNGFRGHSLHMEHGAQKP
jgi:hypothetical protein